MANMTDCESRSQLAVIYPGERSYEPLSLKPITLKEANALVRRFHRHHKPDTGHKFSIGVTNGKGELVGAAIIGRPKARGLDKGYTAEVTRLVTDGTPNACSMLYGAAARAAKAMGYRRIITYIMEGESGTSLCASGWSFTAWVRGRSWSCPSRRRKDKSAIANKARWERQL